MTTCSMSGCRKEGSLLLHIKYKKDNLLQAEYCTQHFCDQMREWNEDTELADAVRRHFYVNGRYNFGYESLNIADALRFLWRLKNARGLNGQSRVEIMAAFEDAQTVTIQKIKHFAIRERDPSARELLSEHGISVDELKPAITPK